MEENQFSRQQSKSHSFHYIIWIKWLVLFIVFLVELREYTKVRVNPSTRHAMMGGWVDRLGGRAGRPAAKKAGFLYHMVANKERSPAWII